MAAAVTLVDANGQVLNAGASASVTITRPANTTSYTAGDVIGQADGSVAANAGNAIHEFTNMGAPGSHVLLTSCDLRIDLAAVPSGMTSFRLHLYADSPTAILDNAVWDLPAGDRSAYRGYVDFGSPVDVGSTLWVQVDQVNRHIKMSSGATSLYGLLVTNGAYAPASGTVYAPRIRTISI